MELAFFKMQGAGNDFIVMDNRRTNYTKTQLQQIARRVCQRKISVGGDALMVVEAPVSAQANLRMRFFNADGSEAEMCGNGARCLARYAYEQKIAGAAMVIDTMAGPVPAWRLGERRYKVRLNPPSAYQKNLPLEALTDEKGASVATTGIDFADHVDLGDPAIPHLVVSCPNLLQKTTEELREVATAFRWWSLLEKGANVNFFALPEQPGAPILVRTFERGVEDFTLACGTGSGSVAYVLAQRSLVDPTDGPIPLAVPGGLLEVEVKGTALNLIGDTNIVLRGLITDEDLNFD